MDPRFDITGRRTQPAAPGWIALSAALHAGLLLALVWLGLRAPAELEPEPIPVTLLKEPESPAEPPQPPSRPSLRFHARGPSRLEPLRIPLPRPAAVPLPPAVEPEPFAAAGGEAIEPLASHPSLALSVAGEGGGTAGAGLGTGNGFGGPPGSFAEYVGGLRQVGLDVVFAIDATGSMGWLIEEVRARVGELAHTLRRLVPSTRFGVVAYRDRGDPEFVTRVLALSFSTRKLERFLDGLRARGGGDGPEAVDAALEAALTRVGWRRNAHRVIVLVADAPPHPERLSAALELAQRFHAAGGTLTVVDVSFDANPQLAAARLGKRVDQLQTIRRRGVLDELRALARSGGGDATTLAGDTRVVRRLALLVFGERFAAELRPLLGDL